ncbi:hypothetical protein [Natrialba asiatica]|uniref:Uncharacterized protein n=1 Tax=Natrialba asiatica (strain ATCC 700177 / DSM 12278 / JCM 9576 / FERM P-10747 / NBRC 102637 / 172P1) TaxID=29540 RepID=M0AMR6_NATA1|nr:hypothetical protein [Natrialba asiatica]ELY99217.1 hypothetical protein C481_15240 [Natrialba asiatica DSM 12278]
MTVPTSIVSSIVPFDPVIGFTIVAGAMLTVFVATMVVLALAPVVSNSWTDRVVSSAQGGPSIDPTDAD